MSIVTNGRPSGFRKWVLASQPTTNAIGEGVALTAAAGVITGAIVDQSGTTPDQPPHRPWLVPGVGKL